MCFTLKGPFGIKQRNLPVIVTASVIARPLPRIFKPSPLYLILFKALCSLALQQVEERIDFHQEGAQDLTGCAPKINVTYIVCASVCMSVCQELVKNIVGTC